MKQYKKNNKKYIFQKIIMMDKNKLLFHKKQS